MLVNHAMNYRAGAAAGRVCSSRSPAAALVAAPARLQQQRRRPVLAHSSADNGSTTVTTAEPPVEQQDHNSAANGNGNGQAAAAADAPAAASSAASFVPSLAALAAASRTEKEKDKEPSKHLEWTPDASALPGLSLQPLSGGAEGWTKFKLAFALPWRRFKPDAVLAFKLEGEIADQLQGRFAPGFSMPQIVDALEKAALDPRVKGIAVELGPLAIGWSKVQELRRYFKLFRESGKFTLCYFKNAGEKEYYLSTAFDEVFLAPSGNLRLAGFSTAGTFLRGVLDKAGVEPQVERIGAYKSAGDQLLRRDMSEAQREQLSELLDDIYGEFLATVAEARGKTREEVAALLDRAVYDNDVFAREAWVTGLKYEDEIIDLLKGRTGGKEDEVRRVGLSRYARVSRSAFGLNGKKRIAVLRAGGAILGKAGGVGGSGSITPDAIIPKLRALAKDKRIEGVVLRVDSPGGDALASDLMWREIRKLAAKKPVVACMGDVAASGGYYMSMAAQAIVAAPLTITGSIGVVTGKLNLSELYGRIGYNKTLLSRGKFAEFLAADNRSFNPDERALFGDSAQHAYRSFRDKAAGSRGMSVDDMQAVAQGRVWTGQRAQGKGLVDVLGGLHEAVALVKQAAGIDQDEKVTLVEVSRSRTSPLALVGGGASLMSGLAALATLAQGGQPPAAFSRALGMAVLQQATSGLLPGMNGLSLPAGMSLLQTVAAGQPLCLMTEVDAGSLAASAAGLGGSSGSMGGGGFFDEEEGGVLAGVAAQLEEALEQLL